MWKEICISNLIGLACRGKEISHFCFVLLCIRGQIPEVQAPQGAYIWRGLFLQFYGIFTDMAIFFLLQPVQACLKNS